LTTHPTVRIINAIEIHSHNNQEVVAVCVALIGGMERLERHYIGEAEKLGVSLKVFNRPAARMKSKVSNADALVVFTNKVSHRASQEAKRLAEARDIPLVLCHSCGLRSLRDCLDCLKRTDAG
jgi:hypothetical protein